MEKKACPFCKEEIQAVALVCKHCRTRLRYTRAEQVLTTILQSANINHLPPSLDLPTGPISAWEALCYFKFPKDSIERQECLEQAMASAIIKEFTERMVKELTFTIFDVIWGGGDIDPIPWEREVRKRFWRMDKNDP